MSRPNKNKIPINAQPGAGMFQAFANLDLSGLPEGPQPKKPSASEQEKAAAPAKLGRVVLRRETARRGGKCVIVVDDFDTALDDAFIEALGKRLRAACDCGGTVRNRAIELQGEQAARARQCLTEEGFRVAGVN